MAPLIHYGYRGSAAVITMQRPEKRNALSRSMVTSLSEAMTHAEADPRARVIVLTGSGPVFCAGMDLDELKKSLHTAENSDRVWHDAQKLSSLYNQIYRLSKPTIAVVNGAAVAGGAGLMTVCDLAVSVPDAKIGYPEVRRGLVAAMVMPHLLRLVGERTARWLLLTGELIDGIDALRLGLVNQVANPDHILNVVDNWCQSLEQGGPKALATTKELLRNLSHEAMAVEQLGRASAEPRLSDECQQGLEAFFEKRPAPWSPSR